MSENNKTASNEIVYEKASMMKRFIAYFFDLSLWLLTSFIFFSLVNTIVNSTGWYKQIDQQLVTIRNDSKLYLNNVIISKYVETEGGFESIKEQNEFLTYCIDEFYSNSDYFTDTLHIKKYNERKLTTKTEGVNLFIIDGETIKENSVNPTYLNEFYKNEVDNYCVGYLFNNKTYGKLSGTVFMKSVVEFASTLTFFFLIFFLVLPLTCFKRGRQTIGMKLEKIALINAKAVNVPTKIYLLRVTFMLLVMVYVNFFSFLIPSFVSVGMMLTTKTAQSLPNYIFNDYFVDVNNQHIYLNEVERYLAKAKMQEVSIENNDFIIK